MEKKKGSLAYVWGGKQDRQLHTFLNNRRHIKVVHKT